MLDAIYIAAYRSADYNDPFEAEKHGGLYITSSDISGGYTGLMDALDAAGTALRASGADWDTTLVVIDETYPEHYVDQADLVDKEFYGPEEFWDLHVKVRVKKPEELE